MFDKLKQMNDMRKQAKELQDTLSKEEIIGVSRNEYVKITMDGAQNIKSVAVDEKVMADKVLLERSIKEAVENSNEKLRKLMISKMGGLSGLLG